MQLIPVDLHVHTSRSDGVSSPCKMIKMAKKKNLAGVAITDHDIPLTEDELEKLTNCINTKEILVIPGVEVTTLNGHLILLGVHEAPEKNAPLPTAIKFGRRKNAIIIVPHPFDFLRKGIGMAIKKINFDAIEVYNAGSIIPIFNKKALDFAINNNIASVAGSDAHLPEAIGLAFTIIQSKSRELNDVLNSIRIGRTIPVTNNPSIAKILSLKIRRKLIPTKLIV